MRRRACGTACGCSAYTGGDLDLSTAEGAYYGGMETLRARRESAVKSARVREAQDREARKGRRTGGGQRWFGYTRIYANPDEPNHKKRHIVREEINPVEAEAIRDAAVRVLEHGESVASIARDWTARGIRPVAADAVVADLDRGHADLAPAGRAAGVAGPEVPGHAAGRRSSTSTPMSGWSGCSRTRRGVSTWCAPRRICCRASRPAPSAAGGCITGGTRSDRADSYGCVKGPAGCGGTAIKAGLLEEYVTGAVLDALESPRVQQALRAG